VVSEATTAGRSRASKPKPAELAEEAGRAVKEQAVELRKEGAGSLRYQIDERTNQLGSQTRSAAQALRRSGETMRDEGNTGAAQVAESLAEKMEAAGGYLERVSGDDLVRDLERFARSRPWLLAAGAAAAGLLASRFVKASSERRYESNGGADGTGSPGGRDTISVRSDRAGNVQHA
jgi:hypothetical protein